MALDMRVVYKIVLLVIDVLRLIRPMLEQAANAQQQDGAQ